MSQNASTEHRSDIDRALVEVSHLLVSSGNADLQAVLQIIGEAVNAECAYLVTVPDDDPLGLPTDNLSTLPGTIIRWHRDGRVLEGDMEAPTLRLLAGPLGALDGEDSVEAAGYEALGTLDAEQAGVAIPLLSKQDRFVGYLGIEHAALPGGALREHGRVLSVFGDLLAGYLSRKSAERALSESEERWRKFVEFNPEAILVLANDAILYANEACARLLGLLSPSDLQGHVLRDFLLADQYEAVEERWLAREQQPNPAPLEHEIVRLDGEERTVESVAVRVTFQGVSAVQMVFRDVTERNRSEERYRTFVQTISEAVWRIDLADPIPALALPHIQSEHILQHGYLAECNSMMTRLLGATRTEAVVGQPIRVLIPALDQHVLQTFVENGYRLHNHELSVREDGAPTRYFSLNAVGRLERGALVRIWGSSTEITERVEMERRMVAVLEEQQERIGRDLHDSVGQLLTGIRMLSENLGARHFDPSSEGFAAAKKVTGFAEEALQQVREICRGLVPPQLYQEGLSSALQSLVANMDALSEAQCTLVENREVVLENYDTKLQLYRIAQEAINNALKHAKPDHVWMRLTESEGMLTLEIEDDGSGFDIEAPPDGSLGLYSMTRRASSIRAALVLDSDIGVGTLVQVTLPVPQDHEL